MNGVAELRAIRADAQRLEIGASATLAELAHHPGVVAALSGGGAGGGLHRRADPSQHGHGRRQPLPRHALHLLQPEPMVALRQQSLPQDHGRDVPRGAQEPRRVLCHLQRRSGARADDARRRGRPARAPRAGARCRCSDLYIGHARHDGSAGATASTTWRCSPASSSPACAPRTSPACARPTTRSASAARSSIRWPAWRWRCGGRRTLADLRVAITGTNPRPVLLEGTQELCGGRPRRARVQGPGRPGARPDHVDEDDLHARPLPPPRGRRAGAPAGARGCSTRTDARSG